MGFKELNFYQFRNIKTDKIKITKKNIFFIGDNAQGKTNLLEAIYLIAYGSSFKSKKEQKIINFNKNKCSIKAELFINNEIEKIQINFFNNKKEIKINNQKIKDRIELFEFFPVITLNHEDLYIINGSPSDKRKFLDQTIAHSSLIYLDYLRKYKKILKQRNFLLKNNDFSFIDIIDKQISDIGKKIIEYRQKIIVFFNIGLKKLFNDISLTNYNLSIKYKSDWLNNNPIEILKKNREKDFYYKTTTTGPHRDTFNIYNDKQNFTNFASTGQKRLLALLLKLEQAEVIYKKTEKKPIFLFDDVLLELDEKKRKNFLNNIPNYEQAFFTLLPKENLDLFNNENSEVFYIKDGVLDKKENI